MIASVLSQLMMEVLMARKFKRVALVLAPDQTTTLKELAASRFQQRAQALIRAIQL